jgi:hypothetical protein
MNRGNPTPSGENERSFLSVPCCGDSLFDIEKKKIYMIPIAKPSTSTTYVPANGRGEFPRDLG